MYTYMYAYELTNAVNINGGSSPGRSGPWMGLMTAFSDRRVRNPRHMMSLLSENAFRIPAFWPMAW